MRIDINGTIYETVREAADAYNVTPKYLRRLLNEDRLHTIKPKKQGSKRGRPEPYSVEGLTFPNQKAASLSLGFKYNYVTNALVFQSEYAMAKIAAAAQSYKEKNQ